MHSGAPILLEFDILEQGRLSMIVGYCPSYFNFKEMQVCTVANYSIDRVLFVHECIMVGNTLIIYFKDNIPEDFSNGKVYI